MIVFEARLAQAYLAVLSLRYMVGLFLDLRKILVAYLRNHDTFYSIYVISYTCLFLLEIFIVLLLYVKLL